MEFAGKVREYFVERHECIILTLDKIRKDNTFDTKHRSDATGLLSSINTKQFMATMYLFQEIFVVTGPLSRYLQTVNMDICNALVMVQSAIDSLEKIRNSASDTIQRMEEATAGFGDIEWKTSRIRRRKDKGSDLANHAEECFEVETPESVWKRNTFYVVVDTLLVSLRNRFENNKSLLQSLSVFSPVNFSSFNVSVKTVKCLQSQVAAFCEKYNLNSSRCSEELWNFSTAYKRFNFTQPNSISEDESDCSTMDEEDGEENRSDNCNLNLSFSAALSLLCNPKYHLVDAFPELSKAYSIALAIPIS